MSKQRRIGRTGSEDRVILLTGGEGSAGTYLSLRFFGLRIAMAFGPGYSNRIYVRRCP